MQRGNSRSCPFVGGDAVKAMILAAGLGTRLLPLTRDVAKPAIPFANRPLIHYCLEWLAKNGVKEVVINLHHRPESIISTIKQRSWPLKIHLSRESHLLGTAGGVKKAERHFTDGTFIMVNSDCLFEIDLAAPIAHHREKAAVATMVLREKSDEDSYGTVGIDNRGRITEIKARGLSRREGKGYNFTGIHVLEPEVFGWIPRDRFYEINQEVYPRLIQRGHGVWGYLTHASWAEVGSHETYLKAHRSFLARPGFSVVSQSRFSEGVKLAAPVLIGSACQAEKGARIGPSVVLGQDCQIGQGTIIEDSVIWDDVTIGTGAHIRGCILGHRTEIEARTHLEGMAISGKERVRIG